MNRLLLTIILILSSGLAVAQTDPDSTIKRDTFSYFTIVDTNIIKYRLPVNFKKPKNWNNADKKRTEFFGDMYGNTYPDTFDLQDALAIIDTATQLSQIGSAKSWCITSVQNKSFWTARLSSVSLRDI
ncbi:MAG: hypothetical protein ACK5XQ_01500 [Flavobacteriales bacterium]